jgi:hypothetical protein
MNSLKRHNNLTKLNAKTSSICEKGFHDISSYGLLGLGHIKEELCKGFSKILNKFPKHLNSKSEDHLIKPYLKHQLLR